MLLRPFNIHELLNPDTITETPKQPIRKPRRAYSSGYGSDPMQNSTHKAARARKERYRREAHNKRERRMNPCWGRC